MIQMIQTKTDGSPTVLGVSFRLGAGKSSGGGAEVHEVFDLD